MSKLFRWTAMVSWSFIALVAAMMTVGITIDLNPVPVWASVMFAVAYLVAIPLGVWSPVALVFSHARARAPLRRLALAGYAFTLVSLGLTLAVLTDGSPAIWRRASLPVMLVTLALAQVAGVVMTPAGPRLRMLLWSGAAAASNVAVIVTGMVVVDSGNRMLLALLAALLLWGLLQVPLMLLLRRRATPA